MDLATMRSRVLARLPQQRGNWYEINAQDDKAVIRIYDEISFWGITSDDFARELAQVKASEIEVQINSPGGDVFDGLAIFNSLRAHPARVTTRVDGVAASAASVIAQAGDHRVMMSSAQMMIHEAWGLAIGSAAEMRAFADVLDQQNDVMARLYASRAGGDADEFRALMATETWLTDAKAVELGLADEVFEPPRKDSPENTATAAVKTAESITFDQLLVAVQAELERLGGAQNPQPEAPAEGIDKEGAAALVAAFTKETQ